MDNSIEALAIVGNGELREHILKIFTSIRPNALEPGETTIIYKNADYIAFAFCDYSNKFPQSYKFFNIPKNKRKVLDIEKDFKKVINWIIDRIQNNTIEVIKHDTFGGTGQSYYERPIRS